MSSTHPSGTGLERCATLLLGLALIALSGCFSERAFPERTGDVRLITVPNTAQPIHNARAWMRYAQSELADLLPASDQPALVTEDLVTDDGRPIDVFAHYHVNRNTVHTIFGNLNGVLYSAQATGPSASIDEPAPRWPGCDWVWIPVGDGLELAGQLGLAKRDGKPIVSDCIVLLPGFLGDTGPRRCRDLSAALLEHGYHVLGLEQRGAGQTEARYPNIPYTFGTLETGDLLAVAEWLEAQDYVRRTGLVGFCWGANQVLLVAWDDGRPVADPEISPRLRAIIRPPDGRRHYEAGVMAFSPTLRFEEFADQCEKTWSIWDNAIVERFQAEVKRRQARKGYPVTGSLRQLIDAEAARSPDYYPGVVQDGYDYLRLMPYKDLSAGHKMEYARIPTLIVHAVNDPMANAQDIPDFIASVENPEVAALMLPGGGHLGFAPYAREYYFSLILNFFDPQRGAAALEDASRQP